MLLADKIAVVTGASRGIGRGIAKAMAREGAMVVVNYNGSKERAEEVADKINFLLKLERLHDTFCPDYKPDWGKISKTKWGVAFNSDQKVYKPYWTNTIDINITYFNSEETAEKVCSVLNKEIENETL